MVEAMAALVLRSRATTEGDREKLARLQCFSDRQSSTRNCCRAGLAIRLHFVSRCYHSARNHSRLATRLRPATSAGDCHYRGLFVRFFWRPRHRSNYAIVL